MTKFLLLEKLPLFSQGHLFILGECDNGLIQGDRVELKFGNNSWIPAIVTGLGGMFNIVLVADLMFKEECSGTIKRFFETSRNITYNFRFVGRSNSAIDFSKLVTQKELAKIFENFLK